MIYFLMDLFSTIILLSCILYRQNKDIEGYKRTIKKISIPVITSISLSFIYNTILIPIPYKSLIIAYGVIMWFIIKGLIIYTAYLIPKSYLGTNDAPTMLKHRGFLVNASSDSVGRNTNYDR